jgi:hypothetical protein
MADLRTKIGTLEARNPVMSASGTYGHGLESQNLASPSSVGALVSKTVTLRPRHGNPVPRICETEAGFLNSIGLENKGVAYYIEHILPEARDADTLVVTNIGAESVEDFVEMARILADREEIDAFEVNLSCPNVQDGKLPFATDPATAARVIAGVKAACSKPVWAKLSPNGREHRSRHEGRLAHGQARTGDCARRLLRRRHQAHRAALRVGVRAQRVHPRRGLRRHHDRGGRARVPRRRLQRGATRHGQLLGSRPRRPVGGGDVRFA